MYVVLLDFAICKKKSIRLRKPKQTQGQSQSHSLITASQVRSCEAEDWGQPHTFWEWRHSHPLRSRKCSQIEKTLASHLPACHKLSECLTARWWLSLSFLQGSVSAMATCITISRQEELKWSESVNRNGILVGTWENGIPNSFWNLAFLPFPFSSHWLHARCYVDQESLCNDAKPSTSGSPYRWAFHFLAFAFEIKSLWSKFEESSMMIHHPMQFVLFWQYYSCEWKFYSVSRKEQSMEAHAIQRFK